MNDQQICEFIAKKPRTRAAELANHFDVELTTVSSALRALVDVGELVKSTEFSEHGRQCQVYSLSDEFKKSREGKVMLAGIDVAPVARSVVVAEAAPPTAPPVADKGAAESMTKVQRALACMEKVGAPTNNQLREAMGLLPNTYVGAYLATAIKDGRVVRVGDHWKLGIGKAAPPKVLDSVEKVGNIVVATRDASQVPQAVIDALVSIPAPAAVSAPATAPAMRCALWSDGTFELKRGDSMVALLTGAELAFVMDYMEKRAAA
jgi:hypothetical protein